MTMTKLIAFAALLLVACNVPVSGNTDDSPAPAAPTTDASPAAVTPEPVTVPATPAQPAPAPLPPIRVWVSPDIAEEQAVGVRAGVEAWAQTTRGVRDWTFVTGDVDAVFPEDPTAAPSIADVTVLEIGPYTSQCGEDGTANAFGCVEAIGGLWHNVSGWPMAVYLVSTTFSADGHAQDGYQRNPKIVTMHEIGHLFGLHHGDGVIMQPGSDDFLRATWECPDAASVDYLQTHLHIDGLSSCAVPDGVPVL